MIQSLTARQLGVPRLGALRSLLGVAALGLAAVWALRAPPLISAGEPGLYLPAPYGVHMGMPLDQAVSLLKQQGFRPAVLDVQEARNLESGWPNASTIVVMPTDVEGMLRYALATGDGEERITAGALALIQMKGQEPDDSQVDVVIRAGWDGVAQGA